MKQVNKYDLQPLLNRIEMPAYSEVLCVMVQGFRPYLYVLGDTDDPPMVTRRFVVAKTEQEVPKDPRVKYIGSFVCDVEDVSVASHVFEVGSCKLEDFC